MHAMEIMEEIQEKLKEYERSGYRKKILITDLTPRDGQQCKLATRVRTDDLLPLCEKLDKVGFLRICLVISAHSSIFFRSRPVSKGVPSSIATTDSVAG